MRTDGGNGANGGKHPNQILAEIDRTRDEMDRTLAAIEQRLTPGQLVDQGLDYLRQSGANEFVQNLGGAAKQNPMPVAVTAIGLAWLMALGRQPAQPNYGSTSSSGIREGMSSMRDKASGMALRACLVAAGILVFFALFGGLLFRLLGTTLPALRVAGGLLLLLTALDMLRARESRTRTSREERAEAAA